MKIQITLDIEPAEIPLANEIIATLRTLSTNVSINQNGARPNAQPLQHQRSASVTSQSSATLPVAQPPVSVPTQPAPQPPPQSAPQQPPSQQQRTTPPPVPPVHQTPPLQPPEKAHTNGANVSPEQLATLIQRAGDDGADVQAIAGEVSRALDAQAGSGTPADAVLGTWVGAFMATVFNDANVQKRVSVVPYMEIIPALGDPWKGQTRDKVIPAVLRHLTVKRPLDVDRMAFFAQAEAFAALVNSGLIGIAGAVKTIVALLKKPDNRSAAITCLGKTAELCMEQLTQECDAKGLGELQAALSLCNEPTFQYDLEYINDIMGWDPTSTPPAGAASAPLPAAAPVRQVLRPVASWPGNTDTIFSLAYDAPRNRIITGAKDSQVLVFDEAGQRVGAPQAVSGCFVCSLDIHAASDLLLVGGVPRAKGGASASCVAAYRLTQGGAEPAGLLLPSGVKMLSFVRSLPAVDAFLTGETPQDKEKSVVRLYPLGGGASFDSLQPTSTFQGHRDMITAVAPHPSQPSLFISGSRDSQVLLWDHRAAAGGPVSRFAVPAAAAASAPPSMVTCLDVAANALLCGTTSQLVPQWDLRTAAQGGAAESVRTLHVDDSTVLKLAIGASLAAVAVTTFHGLYLADFSSASGSPEIEKLAVGAGPDGKVQHFHDVKWAPQRGVLHAGGISKAVATFQLGA